MGTMQEQNRLKTLAQLYGAWFRMGLFTFGGGYAMLPMIQKEVIEKYHWSTEDQIMDYYAIGQCTPGIIAVNAATFVGYDVAGTIGGIVATLGVVSPSLIIITAIAALIDNFSSLTVVQHALGGIRVAVCVLMFTAVLRLWKKGVKDTFGLIVFLAAFLLCWRTSISTVWLVMLAGLAGYVWYRVQKKREGKVQA